MDYGNRRETLRAEIVEAPCSVSLCGNRAELTSSPYYKESKPAATIFPAQSLNTSGAPPGSNMAYFIERPLRLV